MKGTKANLDIIGISDHQCWIVKRPNNKQWPNFLSPIFQ